MAGILSSNADLSKEEGQAAVIRDLERHQLILDSLVSTGDNASNSSTISSTNDSEPLAPAYTPPILIDGVYKNATVTVTGSDITDVSAGPSLSDGTYAAATVTVSGNQITSVALGPFLSQLSVPVFDNGGNARGTSAVDWQQTRFFNTQVASGNYATIAGGRNNTASGVDSFTAGSSSTASGDSSIAINGTASGQFSVAISGTSGAAPGSVAIKSTITYPAITTASDNTAIGTNGTVALSGTSTSSIIIGALGTSVLGSRNSLTSCTVIGTRSLGSSGLTASSAVMIDVSTSNNSSSVPIGARAVYSCHFTGNDTNTIGSSGDVFIACSDSGFVSSISRVFIASDAWVTSSAAAPTPAGYSTYLGRISGGGTLITGYLGTVSIDGNGLVYVYNSTTRFSVSTSGDAVVQRGFGCNSKTAQTAFASGGAPAASPAAYSQVSDQAVRTLVANIRTALVNNGIMS